MNESINDKMRATIDLLKSSGINGCITGSSMIPNVDFSTWQQVPDIDVFVYNEMQLLSASDLLMYKHGFELLDAGEEWKFNRISNFRDNRKFPLSTIKMEKDGVVVNITWKKEKTNIMSVLASFDMTSVMIGYDISFGWGIDMRTKDIRVFDDVMGRWSDSPKVAKPNPMRKQDTDMYGTQMWVRQFDRVIKYWNRGIDTRPMAKFYIDLIQSTIDNGQLFATDKSSEAYQAFVNTYEPLRDKMVEWLNDRKEC